MKYSIDCPKCGEKYEVDMGFCPGFCLKCGCDIPRVEEITTRGGGRKGYDYAAIEAEIREIEIRLAAIDEKTEQEIAQIRAEAKEEKEQYKVRMRELKEKLRWRNYGSKYYKPVDHSQDLAVRMFGKRCCELSPAELREYNRICAQKSRERAKKRHEEVEYVEEV